MPKPKASYLPQLEEAYATEYLTHYDRFVSACGGCPPFPPVNAHNRLAKGVSPRGRVWDTLFARELHARISRDDEEAERYTREQLMAEL